MCMLCRWRGRSCSGLVMSAIWRSPGCLERRRRDAQIEALGGCRCEQKLTAGQAAFEAREFNRPYYPGIT
jgi:hypothetical protein